MTGGGGAILRCFASPPDTCPTYEDADLPAEHTFLSATLTVGVQPFFGDELYGWDDIAELHRGKPAG